MPDIIENNRVVKILYLPLLNPDGITTLTQAKTKLSTSGQQISRITSTKVGVFILIWRIWSVYEWVGVFIQNRSRNGQH